MNIDILTLFPEMFSGPFDVSIIKRAIKKGLVKIRIHNLRKWGIGKHKQVDGKPYGGGTGMILRVDVVVKAIEEIRSSWPVANSALKKTTRHKASPDTVGTNRQQATSRIILLTPQGKLFSQEKAWELSKLNQIIFVCGHYEGVDERVRNFVTEEISIGNYVLTGGEIPAMVLVDSIVRLVPKVLEKPEALEQESFQPSTIDHRSVAKAMKRRRQPLTLEFPQYTRPASFQNLNIPDVLLSGDHQKVKNWREEQALKKTHQKRPDLLSPKKGNDRL